MLHAMKMLGMDYTHIGPRSLEDFEGSEKDKQIQLDFYNNQRMNLLAEVI